MNFFLRENPDRWYHLAWWLCIVTLPWVDTANNISLILLVILWISSGGLKRLHHLKSERWAWPFFIYYAILIIGLIYTNDLDNALFTLDKKITFLALPLIVVTGKQLSVETINSLKRWFVYSCTIQIILCLAVSGFHLISNAEPFNFDAGTTVNFNTLYPDASPFWMHFSYIQLVKWTWLQPAYFSMYLIFCLAILLEGKYSSSIDLAIHILIAVLIIFFIGLLSIRMAIITFAVTSVFLGLKKIRRKGYALISGFVIVLGLCLWLNPVSRYRLVEEPISTKFQADTSVTKWNSLSHRLIEWKGAWSVIHSNLLFGVGTGGGNLAMDNFYKSFSSNTVGMGNNAHNQYLQSWMENGVIGLLAFLFCLFGPLVLHRNLDHTHVAFIIIFSLMCLTESIGERQKGVVFFTLFQTLFLSFKRI